MKRWAAAGLALVLGAVAAFVWLGRDQVETARPAALVEAAAPVAPEPAPAPAPPPPLNQAAHALGAKVAVSDTPGGPAVRTLPNPTVEGVPLAFLAIAREGDWLQVRLAVRPNGATGWIRASDVRLEPLEYRIVIERGAKRLRVFRGDSPVLEEPVAVGTPRTPTPLGDFFIDAIVENPGGAYGAYQLSVAGFSEVLMRFGGGPGQIAIHGTNRPQLIGGEVSNGCIRMRNDSITRVADLSPLGTPVTIVA